MKRPLSTQSGFTPTLTLTQFIVSSFKYNMLSSHTYQTKTVEKRERSSQRKSLCRGFTLIEMMVSLALFSMVVTVSVGALLMLVGTNDQLQGEQSVMTNLSFALDSMTREIRTGTDYYCVSGNLATNIFDPEPSEDSSSSDLDALTGQQDCATGNPLVGNPPRLTYAFHGIVFNEAGNSITGSSVERIMYYFDRDDQKIYRKVGNAAPQSIVSSGIIIEQANFFVSDSQTLISDGDTLQPTVTIYIEASDPNEINTPEAPAKTYSVQTTITQRILDL